MKILIVEDDLVSLKLIQKILTGFNYKVVTAESGKDAISILEKEKNIDIIVSDVMMPLMDGFQFLTYIKADVQYQDIPVILCTALNDMDSVKKGLKLGAADYIVKPIKADTLAAKVMNLEKNNPGAALVVDDEKLICDLLAKILNRSGIKTISAGSAKEALKLMESNKVSIVLSDILMPEMNGLELLTAIKDKYPSIPAFL